MNGLVKEGSIGAVLFKSKIITEQELEAALEAQKVTGCRIGEALIQLGVVTQEDIDWALSNQLNIPYVRLKPENLDRSAVDLVPAELARRFKLFPVILSGSELSVAMADPLNREAVETLTRLTGCQVAISVGLIREIRDMQDLAYGPDCAVPDLGFASPDFSEQALEAINADLSAATLLNHLLLKVLQHKYSALALQPLGEEVAVVGRGDGRVSELGRLRAQHYPQLTSRIKQLAKLSAAPAISSRGVITFLWQGKRVQFQVFLLGGAGGEYITIKLQITAPPLTELADLELPASKDQDLRALSREHEGLILIAHRDAEEKSRLMDLFLDSCDVAGKNVLLIGERLGRGARRWPRIEVAPEGVDETASTLAAALDHDPDLLAVEDITAVPAFVAASQAVMRGKLVVAGLSYGNKKSVLKQLLYLRQKNFLIPSQLKGIVSCKGVLMLCPACKERYQPRPEEIAALRLPVVPREFYRPAGCAACNHTGYSVRRYLLDVIRFDRGLLESFETFRKSSEIIRYLKENGYRGITEEGAELLERGEIAPGEFVASILL